jgi:glycosyltransferase involved in cell wall biosynthesis
VSDQHPTPTRRAAFISTRIAGTDGVSLEIAKWAHVIERLGIECYYLAGECDRPADRTALIDFGHFQHPEILDISRRAFESERRTPELTDDIMRITRHMRDQLNQAIGDLKIDAVIPENALTIPMNIPLGIAIVQVIQEGGLPCLAHHHDFYWERPRFLVNAVDDLIRYAFPPALPQIQHVVINSLAAEEFSRRTGLSCRIIPNVMDFANPPSPPDDYARTFRHEIGMRDDEVLVLQPTRVVARKGIEHSIELVRRLGADRAKLVITHASGDEGDTYGNRIREYAEIMGVEVLYVDDRIAEARGVSADGKKLFTLADAFSQCDLVAYPSLYEGFGNAFLEAVYYKRPLLCNRYSIYRTDIGPCGFRTVEFDDYLTSETVDQVRRVLDDDGLRKEMVEQNYRLAEQFFSYEVLEDELNVLIRRPQNIYRLAGRSKRFRERMEEGFQQRKT